MVASPRKAPQGTKDAHKSDKKETPVPSRNPAKSRVRPSKLSVTQFVVPSQPPLDVVQTTEVPLDVVIKLEPKSPAPIFEAPSPVSSRPSEAPMTSKDTPPPPDFTSTSSDKASAGRTNRRARSNVSYAEPSLVSKMRRPTKTLVDAVVKDESRLESAEPGDVPLQAAMLEPTLPRKIILSRIDSSSRNHPPRQAEPLSPLRKKDRIHKSRESNHVAPPAKTVTVETKEEEEDTAQLKQPPPQDMLARTTSSTTIFESTTAPRKSLDPRHHEVSTAPAASAHDPTPLPPPPKSTAARSAPPPFSTTRVSGSRRQTLGATSKAPEPMARAPGAATAVAERSSPAGEDIGGDPATDDAGAAKRRGERGAARRRSMMV